MLASLSWRVKGGFLCSRFHFEVCFWGLVWATVGLKWGSDAGAVDAVGVWRTPAYHHVSVTCVEVEMSATAKLASRCTTAGLKSQPLIPTPHTCTCIYIYIYQSLRSFEVRRACLKEAPKKVLFRIFKGTVYHTMYKLL
ncbi:hypothetical protein Trydic_g4360 [Trypoxylus dichotomus]